MNANTTPSIGIASGEAVLPGDRAVESTRPTAATATRAQRAESLQRSGRQLILGGFVVTIAGVILYCAVCFAGGFDAAMGDALLQNALPFSRATLAVLGFGTLVWLVGSFTYLRGAIDAEEEAGTDARDKRS